jgi:hypothetical protein
MDNPQKVAVTRIGWGKAVADDLKAVCNDYTLDAVYQDSVFNRCALFSVVDDLGERYGTIVLYVDDMADGSRHLDIRYVGGQWAKCTRAAAPFLEAYARLNHCDTARVHAIRPGIQRILAKYDFYQAETVLHRRIGG